MSLAIPHQFRKKESPISSTKVNENNSVIVSYINSLETALTSDIYALIPQGTRVVFYQSTAPAGWTLVTGISDKFLRIVSGGGGSTGGTVAASTSLAHTHTIGSHTHTIDHTHNIPNHRHYFYYNPTLGSSVDPGPAFILAYSLDSDGDGGVYRRIDDPGFGDPIRRYDRPQTQIDGGGGGTGSPSNANTGSASLATDSQLGAFAYADVIVCSKD